MTDKPMTDTEERGVMCPPIVRTLTKEIADRLNVIMDEVLKNNSPSIEGMVYHVLSAYLLSHCICILKMHNLSDDEVDIMLNDVISQAKEFSEKIGLAKVKAH